MEFNVKCKVMKMALGTKRPSWSYKMGNALIARDQEGKDLGVVFQNNVIRLATCQDYRRDLPAVKNISFFAVHR